MFSFLDFLINSYKPSIIYFIKMGVTCMKPKSSHHCNSKVLDHIDITLLKLIYQDLAQRSQNNILTKEDFKIFFHLKGLWSDQLFRKFDKNQNKVIQSEEFLETITQIVELPFEKKINELFMIYDLEGKGTISYHTFVKMLFSYPIQQLKAILADEKFKNTLGKLEQSYYFNVKNMVNLEDQYNIDTEDEVQNTNRKSKSMEILDFQHCGKVENEQELSGSAKLEKQMTVKSLYLKRKLLNQMNLKSHFPFKKMTSQTINSQVSLDISNMQLGKVLSDPKAQKCKIHIKKCKIVSSLTLMVKKYAKYIFELNSENGEFLTKEAFAKIVRQHPQIICPFQQSFHSYIWRLDENKLPKFCSEKIKFESQCEIVQDDELMIHGFLKYLKNTILVFKDKKDLVPTEIKCLQGLSMKIIQHTQGEKTYDGITFQHKDGIYPEKKYLFREKKLLLNWVKALEEYSCNTVLDRYELRELIGSGNFSKVWKAVEKECSSPLSDCKSPLSQHNNRCVAIKIIDKQTLHQFAYESIKFQCQLLAQIHHPNIMRMITKEETRSNIFIVTELFHQGSLFQYCQQKQFLDEYEAAIITKQLLEAVAHLADLGIVHRDLKPENVMVIYDKHKHFIRKVKIIDFGFATYLERLKDVQEDRRAKGTPGFVPPEAFLSKTYYENSDLFSIGVILYEMLCGQLPFQGNTVQQILMQTIECKLQFKDKKNVFEWSKVSQDAKDFLRKLITIPESRLSITQALNHQWLQNIQQLKSKREN